MYKVLKNSIFAKPVLGLVVLLLAQGLSCRAQLDATVFEDFTQIIINPYLTNPAASDTAYKFKIRANSINELGLIKNVNRFYLDADKRIHTSRKNAFHFVGIQALNSKLGDYISRSRLQIRYSWFAQLSKKASLSSGVSLGFINYAFLTTHGGTGGSEYAPDGMIGIRYLRPNTSFGFSIQQLFPSVLIPVNQSFQLSRLYNADISHRFTIAPRSGLTAFAAVQHSDQKNILFNFGLMTDISEVVMIGFNNFSFRKSSVNFGVKRIRIFGTQLMVVMTYSIYHSTFPLPDSTLELFIALSK